MVTQAGARVGNQEQGGHTGRGEGREPGVRVGD